MTASAITQATKFFSIIDETGTAARSFATINWDSVAPEREHGIFRSIAYAGGTRFFAGPVPTAWKGYVIEEWTLDGTLVHRFRRSTPWLRASEQNGQGSARSKALVGQGLPGPSIWIENLDANGRLVVYVPVPNDSWRPLREGEVGRGVTRLFYNLHVEVIDPARGEVLASEAVNGSASRTGGVLPVDYFWGTNLGFRIADGPDGLPAVTVLEYSLKTRGP